MVWISGQQLLSLYHEHCELFVYTKGLELCCIIRTDWGRFGPGFIQSPRMEETNKRTNSVEKYILRTKIQNKLTISSFQLK